MYSISKIKITSCLFGVMFLLVASSEKIWGQVSDEFLKEAKSLAKLENDYFKKRANHDSKGAYKYQHPIFKENSPSRFLMQRIRDEAHRFAISYHRRLRGKETLSSPLENIPGIGKKRRLQLLKEFGSLENIRNASVKELSALPGITPSLAEKLRKYDTGYN